MHSQIYFLTAEVQSPEKAGPSGAASGPCTVSLIGAPPPATAQVLPSGDGPLGPEGENGLVQVPAAPFTAFEELGTAAVGELSGSLVATGAPQPTGASAESIEEEDGVVPAVLPVAPLAAVPGALQASVDPMEKQSGPDAPVEAATLGAPRPVRAAAAARPAVAALFAAASVESRKGRTIKPSEKMMALQEEVQKASEPKPTKKKR